LLDVISDDQEEVRDNRVVCKAPKVKMGGGADGLISLFAPPLMGALAAHSPLAKTEQTWSASIYPVLGRHGGVDDQALTLRHTSARL
jgi:hypothetical protein